MKTQTIYTGKSHILNISGIDTEQAIKIALEGKTKKIKVMGKTERIVHNIAVKVEGIVLEKIALPIFSGIAYSCIDISGMIEDRVGDIKNEAPSFEKVFSEDQIREMAISFPHDKKATYHEILFHFSHLKISKRQAGKIRSYILEHFPNRKINIPA